MAEITETITVAPAVVETVMAETEAAITAETEAIMEAVAMETRTEPIPELQMARPMPQISPQRMETMRPAETKTTNTTGTTETTTSQTRRMVRM